MTQFRIAALPADDGDCLVISYGEEAALRHIVIDAGRQGTAQRLTSYLSAESISRLELLIVTHIDADHIEGMLDFLDHQPNLVIEDIWFNGYKHLLEGLDPMGAPQGEMLTSRIKQRCWNHKFGGHAVCISNNGSPISVPALDGGMQLTILSPSRPKLAKLAPVWERECESQGLIPGVGAAEVRREVGLETLGAGLVEMADMVTKEDKSAANGSSIALLAEYNGKRVLLAADAHSDLLCQSLAHLNGGAPVHLDLFKVPHHGSQANVTKALMAAVRCNDFLVSTSGARHGHPNQPGVARMVMGSDGPARLRFNYLQPQTQFWRDRTRSADEPDYECEFPDTEHGICIELL